MSKGQLAIAELQRRFGGDVDPRMAFVMIDARIMELKCAFIGWAFERGFIMGMLDRPEELAAYLALPTVVDLDEAHHLRRLRGSSTLQRISNLARILTMAQCTVEECPKEARHGGLCHGHEKQRVRGNRVRDLGERIDGDGPKARWARLEAATIRFADAIEAPSTKDAKEDRQAYLREKHAFRQAVYRYTVEKGVIRFTKRDGSPLK